MKELTLTASSGQCRIVVGHDIKLEAYLGATRSVIVTDATLAKLYREKLAAYDVIAVPPGEEHKTLQTLETVYTAFCERKLERNALVVSLGGGVLSDLAGFAAATYLRGIRFGAIATTLLAQVDASIGGKNGVDFLKYKNLVGTIRQPEFCLCDSAYLKTLPKRDLHCGFAEIIKHAAIRDRDLFSLLEKQRDQALALESEQIEAIVYRSVGIKAAIVQADETEQGERKLLNFGHTLGHAVERETGLLHGEAISIGMSLAGRISVEKKFLQPRDFERLIALLETYNLPTKNPCSIDSLMEAVERDKKRQGDGIVMVLLDSIGTSHTEKISLTEIKGMLQ